MCMEGWVGDGQTCSPKEGGGGRKYIGLCCNFCISKVQKSVSDAFLYRLVICGRRVW